MENVPTHIQIGPYTYCIVRHSRTDFPVDAFPNHSNQTISIAATLTPQMEAAGLLRAICQIIFEMMGRNPDEAHALSREFGNVLCSTLGNSPEAFAWTMAGLLEDREDRKPRSIIIGKQNDPSRPFYDQPMSPLSWEEDRARKALRVLGINAAQAISRGLARVSVGDGILLTEAGEQAFAEAERKSQEASFDDGD